MHEPRNAGLSRRGAQPKIRRPVAEQGVLVATGGVHCIVNIDAREHLDDGSVDLLLLEQFAHELSECRDVLAWSCECGGCSGAMSTRLPTGCRSRS